MFLYNTTLAGFIDGFLKLLGMSSVPHYFETTFLKKSSNAITISAYYEALIRDYTLSGTARMEALLVEKVELCKEKESPYHEYVSAKITGPNNVDFHISFERFCGDKILGKQAPANSQSDSITPTSDHESSSYPPRTTQNAIANDADTVKNGSRYNSLSDVPASLSTSSQRSLDCISGNHLADDKVCLQSASRRNKTDDVYRTLLFAKTPAQGCCLHFYELVNLAYTLHTADSRYLIGTKQCYYYAGAIIKVLQEVHKQAILTDSMTAESPKKDRAGKWGMVPICRDLSSSEVAQLCNKYIDAINTFKKTVSEPESEKQRREQELHDTKSTVLQQQQEIAALRRELAVKSGAPTISAR